MNIHLFCKFAIAIFIAGRVSVVVAGTKVPSLAIETSVDKSNQEG